MVVNTWIDLPQDYGSLDLHFVEFCNDSPTLYHADPLYREHYPYASWLIDVHRSEGPKYDSRTNIMRRFSNYSFSEDGRFAAIKIIVGEEKYLEVWSLEGRDRAGMKTTCPKNQVSVLEDGDDYRSEQGKVKPRHAMPVVWMPLSNKDIDIAMSWNGSLVALMDRTWPDAYADKNGQPSAALQSDFAVFQCSRDDTNASENSSSRMSLVRYDVQQTCPGLRNYIGEGVFHMVDKSNPDPKDELFITCNGVTIDVYSTFEKWTFLHSIVIDSFVTSKDDVRSIGNAMVNQIRGRHLIMTTQRAALTFDVAQGSLVSFTLAFPEDAISTLNSISAISNDGSLVAVTIASSRQVFIYRTRTWTLHGSYLFSELASDERLDGVAFLCNDSILSIRVSVKSDQYWQTPPGYILDVATMSVVDRLVPSGFHVYGIQQLDELDQQLVSLARTKLWGTHLKELTMHPRLRYPDRCNDLCKSQECRDSGVQEGTSSTGLHFKAQTTDASTRSHLKRDKRPSLTVTMTDVASSRVKTMVIPFPDYVMTSSTAFFADYQYLLVTNPWVRMAWTVPRSFDGDLQLQQVLFPLSVKDWMVCPHGFIRCRFEEEQEEYEFLDHITHPISERLPHETFTMAISSMIEMYELADSGLRQNILRLYGKYLNYNFDDNSGLFYCLYDWSQRNRQSHCDFFKGLLALSGSPWIPPQDMTLLNNPLMVLLTIASTDSSAISLVQIFVNYCIRQAKEQKDKHFLLPIRQCLYLIVDPKQECSELALYICRELAYFPVEDRDVIIGHHALANPVTFRWAFWKPYPWGLQQYKDQVMRLETGKIPSPPKGDFTREIFQASFDMLWQEFYVEDSQGDSDELPVPALFSWPKAIWMMVLRKCRLKHNTTIECHPFELEVLDNPALMALVEYKWNTIGFTYWLVRFFGQICYYILVLTVIFLQIHSENRVSEEGVLTTESGPEGLFIAIIVVAFIFLWLELVQLAKDKQGYIRSIYNWVDLLVFLLPLAGAVNELLIIHNVIQLGLNPGLLSFSVLFIFLHFLFELRVFQVVCHFVSIIIRAIYSIRVFFFVFAAGLLAFAIAILHIFHACVDAEHCSYFTNGFSPNLLRALSVTYFMMGGNYDQVEGGFTSNNFAFHMLMMVFFFFTVILMMNVLIALINNAINDGDQTWQLDWLQYRMRYVESAENLSYDIPGFREKHGFFPTTIYYTASLQKVQEYERKTRQMKEEYAPSASIPENPEFTSAAVVTATVSEKYEAIKKKESAANGGNGQAVAQLVETELRRQLQAERESSEKQIGELRQQLKEQQQIQREQQQVLREQQQSFKEQQESLREQQQMLARILTKLEQ
ncbi:hypothetical protein BGW39_010184 [Mortierella sp. 14UC]|nr:hypothetical protein BGW39_010184 [Mortierella sp. 14UC]